MYIAIENLFSQSFCTTVIFLFVAAALITMKILFFQRPMPKLISQLVLEVLYEKLNCRAAVTLTCW